MGPGWIFQVFRFRICNVVRAVVRGSRVIFVFDINQRYALKQQSKVTCDIDYVFANKAGNPLSVHNVTKRIWYPLLRRLGLPPRRPYQTRHTAATLWLAAGENPEWIARQMGHSTTEMLFRIYSRYVPNLTRFHGVFSPNSKLRKDVVPQEPVEEQESPKPKAYSMTWAQRLKRVFAIDIEKCERCGGPVRIIASIEDPDVIEKILKHLGLEQVDWASPHDPQNRSPPSDLTDQQTTLF